MTESWYTVVPGETPLTRGDFILDCPLLAWAGREVALNFDHAGEFLRAATRAIRADVVVMTQACDHRIVDFHGVYTAPREFLESWNRRRAQPRLRLLSPYREHLSQAFARFFMRVGLPVAIGPIP